eukprot:15471639-Alexandrium_andersonii.AAC.1
MPLGGAGNGHYDSEYPWDAFDQRPNVHVDKAAVPVGPRDVFVRGLEYAYAGLARCRRPKLQLKRFPMSILSH